ncbi:MAG: S8 family serine peptidase [Actinomycetota bacterium]|nr:S8 family serine peptidase [Actinomycetota bacterium]
MHIRLPLAAAVAAVLLAAPAAAGAAPYVPNEVLVRYEDDATRGDRARAQRESGTRLTERLPGGTRKLGILDGETVGETVRELRREPDVAYAVANYIARTSAYFPNDPGFGPPGSWTHAQWNFFGPASVNAPDAWEHAFRAGAPGGRGAVVALLDTGVAYQTRGRYRRAPDLRPGGFARGYDFVDNDRYPNDENGHGTHVAGTVAQWTDNGQGLTGLAYGAKVMPIRVLNSEGAGDSAGIARGILFAARNRADVINLSLEFDRYVRSERQIPEIVRAIRFARRRGAVVVGAAGNGGYATVAYPARTTGVISVAATTERPCQAEYSNWGPEVVAPGGGGDTANVDNPRDLRTCQPGRPGRPVYQQTFGELGRVRSFGYPLEFEGTSMASAHVAATAALIVGTRRLGSRPSPDAVAARIRATARDLGHGGYDVRYGAGMVDSGAAIAP